MSRLSSGHFLMSSPNRPVNWSEILSTAMSHAYTWSTKSSFISVVKIRLNLSWHCLLFEWYNMNSLSKYVSFVWPNRFFIEKYSNQENQSHVTSIVINGIIQKYQLSFSWSTDAICESFFRSMSFYDMQFVKAFLCTSLCSTLMRLWLIIYCCSLPGMSFVAQKGHATYYACFTICDFVGFDVFITNVVSYQICKR